MACVSIFVGTVFGKAVEVAEVVKKELFDKGHSSKLFMPGSIEDFVEAEAILICTSTTGCGDIPAELEEIFYQLKEQFPLLTSKRFGVISLGDSSYGDTYCGSGVKFDVLLEELTAFRAAPLLKVDACETAEPEKWALEWLPGFYNNL